ncbi:hypothetical protein E6R60_26965 [Streptomyces sp. A0642]|uniref:hypothetical protein n=1 Tax=Streptomyces sp. A0642 TaxID=2563100 RepID=UPI0010A2417B|nr:hypothetical protein [Streptomyces sp. A0642]THA72573.1 hypothetical protein E6R60_26965 [Streptomyces sp. A0642]
MSTVRGQYVRAQQDWAIDQERLRHDQALHHIGENALFALMWTARDHEAGLVGLCTVCASDRISQAYGQASRNKCPNCFGTRFEGGFRALIVRPAVFTDADDSQSFTARGTVAPQEVHLETTSDFRVHSGDYAMRATGERLQLRVPQRTTLRTGFGTPYQREVATAYNLTRAAVEDPESVAYMLPPAETDDLVEILSRTGAVPPSFADIEIIRAPLIPLYERD